MEPVQFVPDTELTTTSLTGLPFAVKLPIPCQFTMNGEPAAAPPELCALLAALADTLSCTWSCNSNPYVNEIVALCMPIASPAYAPPNSGLYCVPPRLMSNAPPPKSACNCQLAPEVPPVALKDPADFTLYVSVPTVPLGTDGEVTVILSRNVPEHDEFSETAAWHDPRANP